MSHHIEIFTGGCGICREVVDIVTIGKCKDCEMSVMPVNSQTEEVRGKMKEYEVTAVPTIIIDGKIKVVGRPTFPWFCSDEFYSFLEETYPLLTSVGKSS